MTESSYKNKAGDFSRFPLLWLATCLAIGIFAAGNFSSHRYFFLCFCTISVFGCIIFFRSKPIAGIFLLSAFAGAGGILYQIEKDTTKSDRLKTFYDEKRINSGDPVEIEGVLENAPELAAGGFFLNVKVHNVFYKEESFHVSGNVRLFAPVSSERMAEDYERLDLKYGSRLSVACRLSREDEYLNPGVFLRTEILELKDIDVSGSIKSPLLVDKPGDEAGFAPLAWIYEFRNDLISDFLRLFSSKTSGVLVASLLGNKNFLDKQTAEIFREGGTFHVLVISGLHITFIGAVLLFITGFFRRKRLWKFFLTVGFLWCYALAVGAEVPVVRAALMFTILLVPQIIHRDSTSLNALGACAIVLLVWRPDDLFNPSFHLTFVSVAAIVAVAFPLIEKLRKIGSWSPSTEEPFPPETPPFLTRFCETLYWREAAWEIESARQIWSAGLFKAPYFKMKHKTLARKFFQYVFEGILVTVVVQFWLLPLLVIYFHRVSFGSIILNLWVGFFIAIESFAAIGAIFFSKISLALAIPLARLTDALNSFLLFLPKVLIAGDMASFRLPVYTGAFRAIYVLYYLPLLVSAVLIYKWKPFAGGSLASRAYVPGILEFAIRKPELLLRSAFLLFVLFLAVIIFHPFSAPRADGRLHVDFLDVGQGDSALITFPNGETMLVDGGGRLNFAKMRAEYEGFEEPFEPDAPGIGERVVSEFLWEKGYSEIDYILATHADADHIQGLADVSRNFQIGTAFFGSITGDDDDLAELHGILQNHRVKIARLSQGDRLTIGGVELEVLNPPQESAAAFMVSENNNSIVLRLKFGARKVLLTGDIEKETEARLLQKRGLLQADVVKVAHHGSRTSSIEEFVDATRAEFAIIPVGRNSRFGHPHKEVLERWKTAGARVLTTGEKGTITFSTDGKNLSIETFLK